MQKEKIIANLKEVLTLDDDIANTSKSISTNLRMHMLEKLKLILIMKDKMQRRTDLINEAIKELEYV
jgi:hypothetical protein